MDEFSKILDDLENIEIKLEEEDKALILLNSLPRSYENFRDAMLYGREQSISLEEVQSAIQSKELQKKMIPDSQSQGESLITRGRPEKRTQRGYKNRSRSRSQIKFKCFHCHKEGHYKRNCPDRKKYSQEKQRDSGEASIVSDGYESAEALAITDQDSTSEWIVDSGCSFHMCPTKSWFETLKEEEQGLVILGNNKTCRVKGIGSIRLRMYDGVDRVLQQVRYVPELKRNLISLGTLESSGYSFKAESGNMRISKGSLLVMKAERRNALYFLLGSTVVGGASLVQRAENKSHIWHLRLGHVSERGLLELAKQNLLCGDKIQALDKCEFCILGKAKRVQFGVAKHITNKPFEYVHSDLWGPSRTSTHGGGKYFM